MTRHANYKSPLMLAELINLSITDFYDQLKKECHTEVSTEVNDGSPIPKPTGEPGYEASLVEFPVLTYLAACPQLQAHF